MITESPKPSDESTTMTKERKARMEQLKNCKLINVAHAKLAKTALKEADKQAVRKRESSRDCKQSGARP